jgi:hypothetical protein
MKPTAKYALGLILIALSVLALPIAACLITPMFFVDFCFHEEVRQQDVSQDTRFVYCISGWPLRAKSGGAIYAAGTLCFGRCG